MICLKGLFKRETLNNQGTRLSKIITEKLMCQKMNVWLTLLAFQMFRHFFSGLYFSPRHRVWQSCPRSRAEINQSQR
jgi:hypothetical protein